MNDFPERKDHHFHNPWEYDAEYCEVCDSEMGYTEDDEGREIPWCEVCEESL